jgi:DNA-binding PadR family transcriptional regulator
VTGPERGHTIANVIGRSSVNVVEVEQGALYPALHRLEDRWCVSSYWSPSENDRRFYELTASGKKQ